MKIFFAVLWMIGGVILAFYTSIFLVLIGGIGNIVDGAKASPTDATQIAWGIVEVCFLWEFVLGAIIWIFAAVAVAFGLMEKNPLSRRRTTFNHGRTPARTTGRWPGF